MTTPASDTEMPDRPGSPGFTILSDVLSDTNHIWLNRDPNDKSLDGSMDNLCHIMRLTPRQLYTNRVQSSGEWAVDTYKLGDALLAQLEQTVCAGHYVGCISSMTPVDAPVDAPVVLEPYWEYKYEDEVYRIDLDEPAKLTDAAWTDGSVVGVKFGPEWECASAQHPPAEAREARGETLPAAEEPIKMRNYEEDGQGTVLWYSDLFHLGTNRATIVDGEGNEHAGRVWYGRRIEVNYGDEEESDMMSDDQRSVVIDEADEPRIMSISLHRCEWDAALLPGPPPSGLTQRPARLLQRDEKDGLLIGASASLVDTIAISNHSQSESESPSVDARSFVDDPPSQWYARYSREEDIAWIDFVDPPEASAFSDADGASFEVLFLGRQPSEPLPPRANDLLLGSLPDDQNQSQAVEMTRCVVNGVPNFADNEWSSQWYYTGLWEGKIVDSQGKKHDVTIGTKRRSRHSYMQDLVEKVKQSEPSEANDWLHR